ncbi:MAG: hypothetical protein KZQ99_04110 [Candidatus Thiodiazotropha sp. (ex Dulcina madagascariensis)]|nr:hypothetical protein [Candidatus Thiodiazotropha sp. (ex Epidulcina cf. delphinae)]MCU7922503.1 hypothetical protein [Candidatus Thiodiazotropha sp. (ex Dulcina madagascariensis)]MCU7934050.1 hypothetical protein [Candidatus Thiodiazotropha sp. (ex Dulcina madagascariensis)]
MDQDMELIVFAETGHVLAGATRSQTAGPAPDIGNYVGDGLLLRDPQSGTQLMTIETSLLAIETLSRRDDVLMTARYFQVIDGLPEAQAELGVGVAVALDGTDITLTLPNNATALQPVDCVVVVQGSVGGDPIVQRLRVEQGDDTSTESMPLPSDDYAWLLLVPGYRQQVDLVSVP